MLTLTCRGYCQAVDYYLALPNNNDLAEHKIPSDLWRELQDIEMVLSVRHEFLTR